MIPGVHYPAPPVRDFDAEESDLRAEIAGHERLARAIYRLLPAFVTESAVQRMGILGISEVLDGFHTELRAAWCEGLEAQLEDLAKQRNQPQPNLEAIHSAMEEPDEAPQSSMSNGKPDGEGAVRDEANP